MSTYGDDPYEGDTYMEMLSDYDILTDDTAPELLWAGWFDETLTPEERSDARELFLDYMDWDPADFDWDSWREYYGESA